MSVNSVSGNKKKIIIVTFTKLFLAAKKTCYLLKVHIYIVSTHDGRKFVKERMW